MIHSIVVLGKFVIAEFDSGALSRTTSANNAVSEGFCYGFWRNAEYRATKQSKVGSQELI